MVKVASSDAYRAAQQKRQAGQQLTEEEESALASMERHARHLEAKSSRAEALGRGSRVNAWVVGLLVAGGLVLGSMLLGSSAERSAEKGGEVVGSSIEKASEAVGSSIEKGMSKMNVNVSWGQRKREQQDG